MIAQNHLLIAGTGRAGTSFLVRYLTALGLDTTLSRQGAEGNWDENANAGLEDLLLPNSPVELPYVIKSPWSYELVDDLLDAPGMCLDAVIIPMRDLVEAASSRTIVELRARYENAPWMADLQQTWETWGQTPGGSVYSLNPVDQARLLATGFHRLVHRLTEAQVPVLLIAFPRFIEDADYLYEQLRGCLGSNVTREMAHQAHATVAAQKLVRVGSELAKIRQPATIFDSPSINDLDRIALGREVKRQSERTKLLEAELERLRRKESKRLISRLSRFWAKIKRQISKREAVLSPR